jgi:Holliday junction resolvase RusA-like endonuclease
MIIKIKPLSVNEAWQGKRYKTAKYKAYEKMLMLLLPKMEVNSEKLQVDILFGISNKNADIDNPVKPLLDILQKKYRFNDRQIYALNIKKIDVKKGQEFIEIKLAK